MDLKKGTIRLYLDVTTLDEAQIEKQRMTLAKAISKSIDGVLVDCWEVKKATESGIAGLYALEELAKMEGKKFALYGVSASFLDCLRAHREKYPITCFGIAKKDATMVPSIADIRKTVRENFEWRRIVLPLVGGVVLLLAVCGVIAYWPEGSVRQRLTDVSQLTNFESSPIRLSGSVRRDKQGSLIADVDARVHVLAHRGQETQLLLTLTTGSSGNFESQFDPPDGFLIEVIVVSG